VHLVGFHYKNSIQQLRRCIYKGTSGLFFGVQGEEAGHFPPPSARVKNAWIYTSTPSYDFTV